MRRGNRLSVENFTVCRRAAVEIRAIPGGDAIGAIVRIVFGDIGPTGHGVRRAHPVDPRALRNCSARLDQTGARLDAIAGVDTVVVSAIYQGKTKGSAGRK